MQFATNVLDELRRIVGTQNVLTEKEDLIPYAFDGTAALQQMPACVVFASTTREVSSILKLANQTKTPVVTRGSGTGLSGGSLPVPNCIVLCLVKMDKILELDRANLTMLVEPGVTTLGIADAAAAAGLFYPPDPGSMKISTIGGNVAENSGGLRGLKYGVTRNYVMGLEAVLPDGEVVWMGNKCVKDVAGYSLKDVFIGSEGTLGIITAAVLRLFPKPAEKVTAMAGLSDLEMAPAFFARVLERAGSCLTGFEIMPRIGVEFVLKHGSGVRDPFTTPYNWYLLFELSSPFEGEGLTRLAERLLEEGLKAGEIDGAIIASSLSQTQELWRLRELMSEVQKHEGGSIKHDVAVPVAHVPELIARANQLVELMIPGARPVPFGHLGDGNIHYNVSQPPAMDRAIFLSYWEALNAAVHEIVLDLGGTINAEHGIGRMKRDLLPHAKQALELELMREIKSAFDPNGILNPGKLL